MNPFAAHGIQHLSPSSCNLFVGSPAAFVLQKCLKHPNNVGAAAHRGTSTETGIAHGLLNPAAPVAECIAIAMEQFSQLTALSGDPRLEKERDAVPEMVKIGLTELRPYGIPTSTQGKIEYAVEGLAVPMIGFYDFEWEDKGILTDLKTTHALPSSIKMNHARQVALYRAARGDNLSAMVTYVTPKKVASYKLENAREHVQALGKIALQVQNFLSLSEDPMKLASYVVPDIDGSFYFNDPLTRQAAYDIWGV